MSKTYAHEDSLRHHDVAVYNWLEGLRIDYGDIAGVTRNAFPILRSFSTPDRPFASLPNLLVHLGWISGATAAEMQANAEEKWPVLPLPVCSIYRLDPLPDPEQAGSPKTIKKTWLNPVTGMWEVHPWPGHYRTDYTLTFWSRMKYTDAFIREWIYDQIGRRGATHNEIFLPVQHDAPWGLMRQSFKMVGSSDLSDLEGEGPRYIRTEFNFSLRTWMMRRPEQVEAHLIHQSVTDVGEVAAEGDVSANLFFFPVQDVVVASTWPRTGAATVDRPTSAEALEVHVNVNADSVELAERLCTRDHMGFATVSTAFDYVADAPVVLEINQTDPVTGTVTQAFALQLPPARLPRKVHVFTRIAQPLFSVSIAGSGVPAVATVSRVDIRTVRTGPLAAPTEIVDAGTHWHYRWASLAPHPVLVIAQVLSTPGPTSIQVESDAVSPSFTRTHVIDSTVNEGVAALVQPETASIVVKVPKTVALASLALYRYGGPYHGHEV